MCWVIPPASPRHHVGVPDRVEQLGLAVVDVTHDRDHRRPGDQLALAALVRAELDVERLQQFPVLFLGRDDLNVVVQLRAEQLQRLVVDRLGRGHHLTQVQQHRDQGRRVRADLVGEVAQARAPAQPDNLPVTAGNRDAADRRRLHVVEFLAPLLPRLAGPGRPPAGTSEGARGAAATATAAARTSRGTAAARTGPGRASARSTGVARAARARAAATAAARPGTGSGATRATAPGPAGTTAPGTRRRGPGRHVHRARPGTTGAWTGEPARPGTTRAA